MKTLEEARAAVLSSVARLPSEPVILEDALDRVLAEDVVAPENVPPFRNSAMDGYAVRGADVSHAGAVLEMVGELAAGASSDLIVGPGQALKIMTGAPMPAGADTVVMVEMTVLEGNEVTVSGAVDEGTSVRQAGGDVSQGDRVFVAGTRLTPMHIGVLATIGIAAPVVARPPKVAFMSTGDELMPVDQPSLPPGAIRDSNRPMLRSLLTGTGADLVDLGVVRDNDDELRSVLKGAGESADAIVSTGGVSMGDHDVTKRVLQGRSEVEFWKIAIQPAKPFAFGTVGGALFFGLPGNPVSGLISFENFVRPALLTMQGARHVLRPRLVGVAGETFDTDPEKTVFVRVNFAGLADGLPGVVSAGGQGSNVLSAAANADAFAVIERGVGKVPAGERVVLEMFKWPENRGYTDGI